MPLLKVNQIASYSGNTLTVGTTGDTVTLAAGASSSGFGATYNSGLNWTSTLVTSALTLTAGTGYFVNTSTAAITVTLPASPTFGSIIGINDYSGYGATNNITVNPNGNKLEGGTLNKLITTNKESLFLTYTDTTRGWLPTSGVNNGSEALSPLPYTVDFLVIAGGGGGGNDENDDVGAGGGGAGGYRSSNATYGGSGGGGSAEASLSFQAGTIYTITVGAGGAGATGGIFLGTNGVNSSISGTGLTTITSLGGGGGGGGNGGAPGSAGGSGGGSRNSGAAGAGTANQGYAGQVGTNNPNGGGGGAAEVGGTDGNGQGGDGVASTITGSSVVRAGGGGGGNRTGSGAIGGNGGGGAGGTVTVGTSGTANTGGGGGGTGNRSTGGTGGSGVVILRMPTVSYSGTTTGSPTVSTSGSDTILTFTASGTYTG